MPGSPPSGLSLGLLTHVCFLNRSVDLGSVHYQKPFTLSVNTRRSLPRKVLVTNNKHKQSCRIVPMERETSYDVELKCINGPCSESRDVSSVPSRMPPRDNAYRCLRDFDLAGRAKNRSGGA